MKKEDLANGNVLRELVRRSYKEKTTESIMSTLWCLRDSYVFIPCTIKSANGDDIEQITNSHTGDTLTLNNDIRFTPDILMRDDKKYFPVFSSREEMGEDYGNSFSTIQMHFTDVIGIAEGIKDAEDIVLDAFSNPFVIHKDWFEIIRKLPTQIEEE